MKPDEKDEKRYHGKSKGKQSYDDIIGLPHHVSKVHPQMPVCDRAAQFAPFAALSGFEEAIRRTAREDQARKESGYSR